MRRLGLCGLIALALSSAWAHGANAAQARPANPPAPRANTEMAARAWYDTYVFADGYMLAGLQPEYGAILFDPATVALQDGHVSAMVRGELFKAQPVAGVRQRSYRDRWLFDCTARTSKEAFSEAFPQSNLQGTPVQVDVSKHDWGPFDEGSAEARLMAQVCSIGSIIQDGADRTKALPPELRGIDETSTRAWMGRYVDAGAAKLIHAETGIGIYADPEAVTRTEGGRPRVWMRTEFALMLPGDTGVRRSLRDEVELDCLGYRYLRLRGEIYPGSNLLGRPENYEGEEGWREAAAGTIDGRWLAALCRSISGEALAEPPAPSGRDATAVRDWLKAYVNANRYVLLSTIDNGALFYGADDLEAGEQGHILANLRIEEFDPPSGGGDTSRSALERAEIDCRAARYRVIESTRYAGLNLTGAAIPSEPLGWTKPASGTIAAGFVISICAQASLLSENPLEAIPTPLYEVTQQAVDRWLEDNIDTTDYAPSGFNDRSIALYSTKELERTRQDYVRIWTRLEMFQPMLEGANMLRSMRMLIEFDCAEHRSRTLALEAYPGSNMTGTKTEQKPAQAEWSFISPQALLSNVANDVCGLKDAVDQEATDPAKALPTSTGRQDL